jgi:hypothetical protein|tara:strand:- start:170 stop:535 length:366 start_codon:yes stop_codon:yes gene_type:complete
MSQKVLWWIAVAVVVASVLAPDLFGFYALTLMGLGLVSGFMYPVEDVTTRIAFYVLAVFLPGIADAGGERGIPNDGALLDIPFLGGFVHGFLTNFALVIAGVAIMSVLQAVWNGLTAAGDD